MVGIVIAILLLLFFFYLVYKFTKIVMVFFLLLILLIVTVVGGIFYAKDSAKSFDGVLTNGTNLLYLFDDDYAVGIRIVDFENATGEFVSSEELTRLMAAHKALEYKQMQQGYDLLVVVNIDWLREVPENYEFEGDLDLTTSERIEVLSDQQSTANDKFGIIKEGIVGAAMRQGEKSSIGEVINRGDLVIIPTPIGMKLAQVLS